MKSRPEERVDEKKIRIPVSARRMKREKRIRKKNVKEIRDVIERWRRTMNERSSIRISVKRIEKDFRRIIIEVRRKKIDRSIGKPILTK